MRLLHLRDFETNYGTPANHMIDFETKYVNSYRLFEGHLDQICDTCRSFEYIEAKYLTIANNLRNIEYNGY